MIAGNSVLAGWRRVQRLRPPAPPPRHGACRSKSAAARWWCRLRSRPLVLEKKDFLKHFGQSCVAEASRFEATPRSALPGHARDAGREEGRPGSAPCRRPRSIPICGPWRIFCARRRIRSASLSLQCGRRAPATFGRTARPSSTFWRMSCARSAGPAIRRTTTRPSPSSRGLTRRRPRGWSGPSPTAITRPVQAAIKPVLAHDAGAE